MVMAKSGLPKSIRKFIRKEKARIRGGILSIEEQKEQIGKLYEKHFSPAKATSHAPESRAADSAAVKPATTKKAESRTELVSGTGAKSHSEFGSITGEESVLAKKQAKKVTSEKRDKSKVKKPKA
jgi:hypothetical protein